MAQALEREALITVGVSLGQGALGEAPQGDGAGGAGGAGEEGCAVELLEPAEAVFGLGLDRQLLKADVKLAGEGLEALVDVLAEDDAP